ncbi:MAG: sugar ABC transporter permease, partial [Deltaproteobacteria bacterium]|nr:sugar ABC transporter permease [Deltaproteobacteria bacterium]
MRTSQMSKKNNPIAYLYIIPHAIFYGGFIMVPLFLGFYMSLNRWSLFKGREGYVGLKYYRRLFVGDFIRGDHFWQALLVTVKFVVYFAPALVLISLGLALLIHSYKSKWLRACSQFSFLVPTAIAISVGAVIWRWILGYESGILNYALTWMSIEKKPWLTDLPWAWLAIILPTLWMACGWNMILFMVGLQRIPPTLYEAARVDGANAWNRFVYITLPGLRPVTIFIVITTLIGAFNLFAQPQLLTGGGPGRATTPVM